MKKLFIDKTNFDANVQQSTEFKKIIVFEDKKELFIITKYRRALTPPNVDYNGLIVPVHVVELSMEIYKHFDLHFNYLNLQP
jgi:hypothetical protein